ncbi:MAG: hypothetical protein DBY05_06660 [Clostridiales bacterium]|nr:MAG: hypothetical protein DBY05_06660 [Clostridiales bacterium]
MGQRISFYRPAEAGILRVYHTLPKKSNADGTEDLFPPPAEKNADTTPSVPSPAIRRFRHLPLLVGSKQLPRFSKKRVRFD